MDKFQRKIGNIKRECVVYSKDEADAMELTYFPWRACRGGDWALSDDGYVGECLQVLEHTDKKKRTRKLFTFTFGKAWDGRTAKLEWLKRKASGVYSQVSTASWIEQEARKTRTKMAVKMFVAQYVNGKIDYDAVGKAYRPDAKIPAATVRKLFKQEKIQEMIMDELDRILADKGITKGMVLDTLLKAITLGEVKGDGNVLVKVAKELMPLVGMGEKAQLPENSQFNEQVLEAMSQKMLEHDSQKNGVATKFIPHQTEVVDV